MPTLRLTLRHLIRYWRLNLVVLGGILLGTTFAASPPLLATVIAGQSLAQSISDATPSQVNLQIHSRRLSDELRPLVDDVLGELKAEELELRQAKFFADPTIIKADGEGYYTGAILYLELWSMDRLPEVARLVEGRFPRDGEISDPEAGVIVEAALGADAASGMDLGIGDILISDGREVRVRVVGIIEPTDPRSELWWGDERLLPFNILRESGLSDYDTITVSMLLTPSTMDVSVPEHEQTLRVVLNRRGITVTNADPLREEVLGLGAQVTALEAQMETGLVELIEAYQDQSRLASVSLILLTAQSFLAILYTLGMVSTYLLDQSRLELVMLTNRGFSSLQILRIFATESGLLTFGIALPAGPLLAFGGFSLWSAVSGIPVPGSIPVNSWALAGGAAAFAWLALVIPLFFATKGSVLDWERRVTRPRFRRQMVLDWALIALGGFVYWQLRESGSVISEGGVDPILLIGPTLLLFAIGLLFLRLFPILLRGAARLTRLLRGLSLPLGLNRLARLPMGPNRIVLLISLTIGLSLFASVFSRSVAERQSEMASYLTGADVRLTQPHEFERANTDLENITSTRGVQAASQVYRTRSRWGEGSGIVVDFLAVDPGSFAQVSHFPEGYRDVPMAPIMTALETPTDDAIPIVLSHNAPPRQAQIGDRVFYRVGRDEYEFEVRGIIINFPTVTSPFAITNLPELNQVVDLGSTLLAVEGTRELWVDVDPNQYQEFVTTLEAQALSDVGLPSYRVNRIADNAFVRLETYQADQVARTATTAFRLNTVILGTLSVGGFTLIQVFAVRGRRKEFAVLQILGLSLRQLLGLVFLEGVALLIFGIGLGVGIGFGLANLMRPFLSITLAASLGGGAIDQIVIHWPSIVRELLLYMGAYLIALLLLLGGILFSDLLRALRVAEE